MGAFGGPTIEKDNLVLILDAGSENSYPGSGTTWYDLSGNGNNGTLNVEGIGTVSASLDTMAFDGSSDEISANTSMGNLGTNNWTIEFWWKSNGTQDAYATIIGQGFTVSQNSGAWAFKVKNGSNKVSFTYCTPTIVNNNSSTNPNDDEWHYIVGTRSGTSVILYMDTTSIKTFTLPADFSFGTGETTYIGYNPRDVDYINGCLSNIKIYDKALTTTEITQNFNSQRSRFGV